MNDALGAKDSTRVAGYVSIYRIKNGKRDFVGRFPNKVVMSSGYGRNIIARQLAGDATYAIAIDSAALGTSNTAAADGQTDLVAPTVTAIPLTNITATNDQVTVDVFVADANLTNGIYQEFGLYCGGRLFARVVISPAYTKAAGEDTLFTYELTIS